MNKAISSLLIPHSLPSHHDYRQPLKVTMIKAEERKCSSAFCFEYPNILGLRCKLAQMPQAGLRKTLLCRSVHCD